METLATLLPLLLIAGVFWLLILRPAKARQKAQQDLVSSVRPGQRIMTTAGMFGTVTEVTDEEIGLEIAPGVVVRYVKAAVGRVLPDDEPMADDEALVDLTEDAATDAEPAAGDDPDAARDAAPGRTTA